MAGFCPHDWHQTTEADLQHMALGGGDYEYAVWSDPISNGSIWQNIHMTEAERKQKIVTDKAHSLAERLGLIPYSQELFARLMDEVEREDP